jgi:hypothetical protein
MGKIKINKCNRCGWEWIPRSVDPPKRCAGPSCRSPYWQTTPVVYVIQGWGGKDLFKIGCTNNLLGRYGSRSKIVATINVPNKINKYNLEEEMHKLFLGKRVGQAEVFKLSKKDLLVIKKIAKAKDPMKECKDFIKK